MGVSVSKEQYMQACAVDLYDFLIKYHGYAVKKEYGSVLLQADKHVSVKQGYHGYRNFRTGETGNNIDYLMNYFNYTYQEAVLALIGEDSVSIEDSALKVNHPVVLDGLKEINIPKPLNGRYSNLYAFLSKRKIPVNVIQRLVDEGIMYQSEQGNNIVFVSPAGDYCELRGTNTYADRRCRRREECERFCSGVHGWCQLMDECQNYRSDPFHGCKKVRSDCFWFFAPVKDKSSEVVYVCEAAIDAISLYVIHMAQKKHEVAVYVSIGGVANQRTIDRLVRSGKNIVLAVDNDQAGEECRNRNLGLNYIIPRNKDWNEDLQKGDY